jgi:hypothetical protein
MNCLRFLLASCIVIVCVGCHEGGDAGSTAGQGGGGESAGGEAGSAGSAGVAGSRGGGVGGNPDNGNVDASVVDAGIPVESAPIHYYGRWNRAVAGRAITVNTGSHVEASQRAGQRQDPRSTGADSDEAFVRTRAILCVGQVGNVGARATELKISPSMDELISADAPSYQLLTWQNHAAETGWRRLLCWA